MNSVLISIIVVMFSGWVGWYSDECQGIDEHCYYWAIGILGGFLAGSLMVMLSMNP